jgi:hypothetical protein
MSIYSKLHILHLIFLLQVKSSIVWYYCHRKLMKRQWHQCCNLLDYMGNQEKTTLWKKKHQENAHVLKKREIIVGNFNQPNYY